MIFTGGDQAGAAAHRGADQHRPAAAELLDDGLEVVDHDVLAVGAVGAQWESPWPRASKATAK